jgi:hypothetical protein
LVLWKLVSLILQYLAADTEEGIETVCFGFGLAAFEFDSSCVVAVEYELPSVEYWMVMPLTSRVLLPEYSF